MWDNKQIADDAKHQMMPLLRVTLVSRERMRKSAVRVADAVVLCHSLGSAFDDADCAPPLPPLPPLLCRRAIRGGSIMAAVVLVVVVQLLLLLLRAGRTVATYP
jgi:hypothetical protein